MLHIATPLYRTQFLDQVYNSIPRHEDIIWHISKSKHTPALTNYFLKDKRIRVYEVDCLDSDTVKKRNAIFDHIKDGYFFLLDDDTIFLDEAYLTYREYAGQDFIGMVIGNQKYGASSRLFPTTLPRTLSSDPETSFVDSGMVICHHSVLEHVRWVSEKYYANDVNFWCKCYSYFGIDAVKKTDRFISYYNRFGPKIRIRKKIFSMKTRIDIQNPFVVKLFIYLHAPVKLYKKVFSIKTSNLNTFPPRLD